MPDKILDDITKGISGEILRRIPREIGKILGRCFGRISAVIFERIPVNYSRWKRKKVLEESQEKSRLIIAEIPEEISGFSWFKKYWKNESKADKIESSLYFSRYGRKDFLHYFFNAPQNMKRNTCQIILNFLDTIFS